MKPYILGAICIWFVCGVVGAALLGQQRVEIPTIAGGPIALWNGLNKPMTARFVEAPSARGRSSSRPLPGVRLP